jgi:hypothetical protein
MKPMPECSDFPKLSKALESVKRHNDRVEMLFQEMKRTTLYELRSTGSRDILLFEKNKG